MTGRAHRMAEIGLTTKAARVERAWSQSELADHACVSRPSIARIEGGDDVSTATLAKVAHALGLQTS